MNIDEVKEKIISIYPNVVMMEDTHVYGVMKSCKYILMSRPPKGKESFVQDRHLKLDYRNFWSALEFIHLMSSWRETEEECWFEAWETIEKLTLERLNV